MRRIFGNSARKPPNGRDDWRKAWALLLTFAAMSAATQAGAVDVPLSSNDPSQVVHAPPPKTAPGLTLPAPASPAPAKDTITRFVLQGVRFDNAVAVPEARLAPAWADLRGKPIGLPGLRAIGLKAEAIYAKAGYPFVAIRLRVQEVNDGIVHFDVVEGRISDLTVLGANPDARRQATAAMQPLVNVSPLSIADVDRTYALARDVPGLSVSGTLRRGSEAGGMDLVINASREEWQTYLNVNNLYADPVGPWGFLVGVDHFGKSQYGDQQSVQVYSSVPFGRQVLVRASDSLRLNAQGTTVEVSGLWGDANPVGNTANLALATNTASLRFEVSQPLWKRPDSSVLFDLALEGLNQKTDVYGSTNLTDDHLRDVSLSLSAEKLGKLGRLSGSFELLQRIDILGASQSSDADLSRPGADPEALIFRAGMEAESAPLAGLRLYLRLDSQYSGQALTEPDQYAPGNLGIGRGYQPGSVLSDSALASAFEVRAGPIKVVRGITAQPFGFADTVLMWNHAPDAFTNQVLVSTGGGVRFQYADKLHIDLLCAVPVKPIEGSGSNAIPGPTVLLNLTVGLNDLFNAIHRKIATGVGR